MEILGDLNNVLLFIDLFILIFSIGYFPYFNYLIGFTSIELLTLIFYLDLLLGMIGVTFEYDFGLDYWLSSWITLSFAYILKLGLALATSLISDIGSKKWNPNKSFRKPSKNSITTLFGSSIGIKEGIEY